MAHEPYSRCISLPVQSKWPSNVEVWPAAVWRPFFPAAWSAARPFFHFRELIEAGFDVDACACGYDGKRVWVCPRTALAFATHHKVSKLSADGTPPLFAFSGSLAVGFLGLRAERADSGGTPALYSSSLPTTVPTTVPTSPRAKEGPAPRTPGAQECWPASFKADEQWARYQAEQEAAAEEAPADEAAENKGE